MRFPTFGRHQGDCSGKRAPLVVSVTHENAANSHSGAANYDPNNASYMADFDYDADFGRWLKLDLIGTPPALAMSLDTVNFKKVNVTGWPLRYGHLFFGLNDGTVSTALDKPVSVEFDIRIPVADVRPGLYAGYSGRRVMLGALADWVEAAPRANRSHYFEIDLVQSNGYSQSYGDPIRPLCNDAAYDRCFYAPNGEHAEGREVRYQLQPYGEPLSGDGWMHIRIPIADAIRALHWVSPPAAWSAATLKGLYLAIESEGATQTSIEIKNYHVEAAVSSGGSQDRQPADN
ncbi:MAG: hypothetical protein WA459_18440 [Stellaceae bacterium]